MKTLVKNRKFHCLLWIYTKNFQESGETNFAIKRFNQENRLGMIHFKGIDWKYILKNNITVIHFGDFKYSSLQILLMSKIFYKFKLYLHGQGGYKKRITAKIIYISSLMICDGYICYNKFCAESLKDKMPKFLHKKIKT
ncbi:hypothetical protein GTU79_18475 [Sodalis ligni]|uniref:hypothetical protein n=1 Tax=Sodalis ligni TaxID=2697027 RepID=UPI001BDDEB6E|nr:hypothetical protein [Sodalis ligni]QWA09362.1 hypothetical protein GTU79_18475 [Sodalis ligni]